MIRRNTYDAASGDLVLLPVQAEAISAVSQHYTDLFGDDADLAQLRNAYAIPKRTIKDPERQKVMNAFFVWTAWACSTELCCAYMAYATRHILDCHRLACDGTVYRAGDLGS